MIRFVHCLILTCSILSATGQFGYPETIARSEMGEPGRVRTLDVDGDGDLDIIISSSAWATYNDYIISKCQLGLFRNNGSGNFGTIEMIDSTKTHIADFDLADIDLDGDLDIVATIKWSATIWYPNLGNGAFGAEQLITQSPYLNGTLSVCDVDNDGDMDVVDGGDGIYWRENNGNGTFTNSHLIAAGANWLTSMADIDGDGDLDAFMGPISGFPASLGYRRNIGGGNFVQGYGIFQTSSAPIRAWAIPLNAGTVPDVISQSNGRLITHLQNANAFTQIDTIPNATLYELVDINGDGRLDILGRTGYDIGWWPNLNNGQFGVFQPWIQQLTSTSDLKYVDINGDGSPDLIVTLPLADQVMIHLNNGDDTFDQGTGLLYSISQPDDIANGDINGDGNIDLVHGGRSPERLVWLPGDGNGNFGQEQLLGDLPGRVTQLQLHDMDMDGDMDVLCTAASSLYLFINDGQGSQTTPVLIDTQTPSHIIFSAGDHGSDGDLDILIANSNGEIKWWINTNGLYTPGPVVATGPLSTWGLRVADLNSDAQLDVIALCETPDQVMIALNDGLGGYSTSMISLPNVYSFSNVSVDDLDGDGDEDLIVMGEAFTIHENSGNGVFNASLVLGGTTSTNWRSWCMVDIDQDGKRDLAYGGIGYDLHWKRNLGDLTFGPAVSINTPYRNSGALSAGDLNGDDSPDLLVTYPWEDRLVWYPNYILQTVALSGKIYWDADSNGVATPTELGLPYVPVWSQPDIGSVYTDVDGSYMLYAYGGTFEIEALPPGPGWALSSDSASYTVSVIPGGSSISGLDFGFKAVPYPPELETAIAMNQDGCDIVVPIQLQIRNTGSGIINGMIRLELDTLFSFIESFGLAPDSISGSSVFWSFSLFEPGQIKEWSVTVLSPDVASIGAAYTHSLSSVAANSIGTTSSFSVDHEGTVSCGYDPNLKQVDPEGVGQAGYVDIAQDILVYTIHFQNTGNDTAYTVVLRDTLSDHLIISSLEIVGSSAPFLLEVTPDGEAIFRFNNIMLPDSGTDQLGSRGFVQFRVSLEPGLLSGTLITNCAGIYFDNNPPIITNTVSTTLWDCALFQPLVIEAPSYVLHSTEGLTYQWYLNGQPLAEATGITHFALEDGSYTVAVTDTMGCAAISPEYWIIGTSISSGDMMKMSAWPNPFSQSIQIDLPIIPSENGEIVLMDVTGRELRRIPSVGLRSVIIDRGELSGGIYQAVFIDGAIRARLTLVAQ